MAVSKRTRFEVFKRDAFTCQYCGRTPPQVVLEADHIVPVIDGGPDDIDNLATACFDCNRGKSDVPLTSVPRPLSEVMGEAAEKREQMEAYNHFLMEAREIEDNRIHELGYRWFNAMINRKSGHNKWTFSNSRVTSMRTFIRKLPVSEIIDAMDLAGDRVSATINQDFRRWNYFCAVCWNKIRDLESR
jgi:hypothetical protein